jgi:hypothetical protein
MAHIGEVTFVSYFSASANTKYASKFTATESFTATIMAAYLWNFVSGERARYAIYSDNSGSPGALLGVSEEVNGTGDTVGWHDSRLVSSVSITSGSDYWLAVLSDSAVSIGYYTGTDVYNGDTYSDGFADPFGAGTPGSISVLVVAYDNLSLGELRSGGTCIETSDGAKWAFLMDPGAMLKIISDIDGDPTVEEFVSVDTVFGGTGFEYVHVAVDSLDCFHIMAACMYERDRDVAYRMYGGSIFYFNGSGSDAGDSWSPDDAAFNGDRGYGSISSGSGTLLSSGTSAPSSDTRAIDAVKIRWRRRVSVSGKNINMVVTSGSDIVCSDDFDGTIRTYSAWLDTTEPTGGWTWAKINALDIAFQAASEGVYSSTAYNVDVQVLHEGEWSYHGWTEVLDYTQKAPDSPGCYMALDADDIPKALAIDNTKVAGSSQDNVNVVWEYGPGNWTTPVAIGPRAVKSYYYRAPHMLLRDNEIREAFYYANEGSNNVGFRTFDSDVWGSQTLYSGDHYVMGQTSSGSAVYRYHNEVSQRFKENDVNIHNTDEIYVGYYTRHQAVREGSNRHFVTVDHFSRDVEHYINDGDGWAKQSELHVGTYNSVTVHWVPYNYHPVDEFIYLYEDSNGFVYFDSYSWAVSGVDLTADEIILGAWTIDEAEIGEKHALVADDLYSSQPALDETELATTHSLDADDLFLSVPVLDESELGGLHAINADDLTLGDWVVEEAELGQVHALDSDEITLEAPILEETTLGQEHALTSDELTLSPAEIEEVTLGQTHDLVSDEITLDQPILEESTLSVVSELVADEITLGSPILDEATLGEINDLIADEITLDTPILEEATLGGTHILTADEITLDLAILDEATIGGINNLTADDLTGGQSILDEAEIEQVHAFIADEIVGQPWVIDSPALEQIFKLVADDLTNSDFILDSPTLGQVHDLSADALINGAWVLEQAAISEADILEADDLFIGAPVVDEAALGQVHDLQADEITNGAWVLEAPDLGQEHVFIGDDLLGAQPDLESPQLSIGADSLTADELTLGDWTVEEATLSQIDVLEADDLVLGNFVLDEPSIGVVSSLSADDIVLDVPSLESPTIDQVFALQADELLLEAVTFDVARFYGDQQWARPTSDVSAGEWLPSSGGDLYAMLDEVEPDDVDYVYSGDSPSGDLFEVGVSPLVDPQVDDLHIVRFRYRKEGTDVVNLTFSVMEGVTQRATWNRNNISESFVTGEYILSEAEAASISNYNNLRIRVEATEA